MKLPLTLLALCALISSVTCAGGTGWCYHESTCNAAKWPELFPNFCNGSRQSPIDIVPKSAKDDNLGNFTFTGYDIKTKLKTIQNTGKTVKVTFESGVKVSGGGLSEDYDSLQFHLHWGNGTTSPGSEHTVDGKRYPMELHIVNAKSSYNGNTTQAVADSKGLAALGFFIEASGESDDPAGWTLLTSYLSSITTSGSEVNVTHDISLDDLLGSVDRTKFYRYLGSLTTPACNEAVVWTVFKESIKISKKLIDMFGTTVRIGNSTSAHMVDVYRSIQPNQEVTYSGSSRNVAYTSMLGLVTLLLAQLWA